MVLEFRIYLNPVENSKWIVILSLCFSVMERNENSAGKDQPGGKAFLGAGLVTPMHRMNPTSASEDIHYFLCFFSLGSEEPIQRASPFKLPFSESCSYSNPFCPLFASPRPN